MLGGPVTNALAALIGGTAGRTTLNGEGLQHEDGHSLFFQPDSELVSYDPTFQYEVAVVTQDGMRRMHQEQEDVFYYITVMNENYEHPLKCQPVPSRHYQGMYAFRRCREQGATSSCSAQGTIFREVIAAADLLKNDWGVESDLWGCPSMNELARNGIDTRKAACCIRWKHQNCRMLKKNPRMQRTDYIKLFSRQIRPFIKAPYITLGTDGFGRFDTREKLRHHSRLIVTGSRWLH